MQCTCCFVASTDISGTVIQQQELSCPAEADTIHVDFTPTFVWLRYLVLIAGGPGSGKTSSAHVTCQLLNRLGESSSAQLAVVAPMDGDSRFTL